MITELEALAKVQGAVETARSALEDYHGNSHTVAAIYNLLDDIWCDAEERLGELPPPPYRYAD